MIKNGYEIINPFTKYAIPFDAIRDSSKKTYLGKVRVVVYEFDRTSANELLSSDVFTDVHGYAAQGLVTFGMPLILFYMDFAVFLYFPHSFFLLYVIMLFLCL